MKLNQKELVLVGVIIVYIAFFTHPPPAHITNLLESPVGHIVALLGILYVTVYQSLIVGVFLGIAYLMTSPRVTEYMDEKQQTPSAKAPAPPQPKSSGVPPPAITGMLEAAMKKKGDTRLPQAQGKSNTVKPTEVVAPKPAPPPPTAKSGVENFASF